MAGVIVNEWIEKVGGAERVLDAISDEYPDAPILAPWSDAPDRFPAGRVRESWMSRTPIRRNKALSIPFLLEHERHLPAYDADWMLCLSHLFAHQARMRGKARDVPKYVYTYTPARYIWDLDADGRGAGLAQRAAAAPLRAIDRRRAQEPVKIAAVSTFIAERIEKCWGRESTVINPPVDVASFMQVGDELTAKEQELLDSLPDGYLFGASRFVLYKRLDTTIAAGVAAGLPVVLAGDGPDLARLQSIAAEHPGVVTFVGRPSMPMLRALYRRSLAYVFGPVEDFGIMPAEAMATGTPVVANSLGGASETVIDGVTGAHFHSTEPAELRRAVEVALAADPDACRKRALDFDGSTFGARIRNWIET